MGKKKSDKKADTRNENPGMLKPECCEKFRKKAGAVKAARSAIPARCMMMEIHYDQITPCVR